MYIVNKTQIFNNNPCMNFYFLIYSVCLKGALFHFHLKFNFSLLILDKISTEAVSVASVASMVVQSTALSCAKYIYKLTYNVWFWHYCFLFFRYSGNCYCGRPRWLYQYRL